MRKKTKLEKSLRACAVALAWIITAALVANVITGCRSDPDEPRRPNPYEGIDE